MLTHEVLPMSEETLCIFKQIICNDIRDCSFVIISNDIRGCSFVQLFRLKK